MKSKQEDSGNTFFLMVCLMVAVLLVLPAWYAARAGSINGSLLALAQAQINVFINFSEEAAEALRRIAQADPAALSWEQVLGVLKYSGAWIRWPYVVVLVMLGAAAIVMGRTTGLVRRLNMESLLAHNAKSFACLQPIVGRGKSLLSPESYDVGPWRIARSPVQFALEHGLLLDTHGKAFTVEQALRHGLAHTDMSAYGYAYLDTEKANAVLRAQLGKKLQGLGALSDERSMLATAFLAYAAGDKMGCLRLLDTVSASYTENTAPAPGTDGKTLAVRPACPVVHYTAFKKRIVNIWNKNEKLLTDPLLTRHAAYELPWFMALLTLARRKGVLASSQFLWLRPCDRSLWYALNQCGGRAAWAEGFAAWAHYAAEEKAGKTLVKPRLTHAVTRLRDTLAAQGWLAEGGIHSAQVEGDMVLAAAEDAIGPYDAYTDPELLQQQF